ncbi:AbrB family transcriptional regulator [Pseudogemmobacter sp. W21_MBD1_M6]|uniref:AbrB family transcriptional regulator n=1 Tax=Pseudogemmobacter sp. W21_MBD1_M6 TaxID=3240271 RepID=UPI003F9CA0BC
MNMTPSAPPPLRGWPAGAGLLLLFLLTACAGWGFERIGAPLPWMIGPLLLSAAVFIGPAPRITVPNRLRPVGQIVVATQVGLAFSPAALSVLAELAPIIVGTALATVACIFVTALIISRISGQSLAQAFLSAAPTSPVEAAAMARAAGIDPMPVILSQTIRLAAVVLILPFALYAIDGWPDAQRTPVTLRIGDPVAVLILAGFGVAGAWMFRMARVPNPNFLGPMTLAAILSASGFGPAPYPPIVLAVAQIVLGTWLGATFRREIVTTALWMSLVGVATAVLLLLLCSLSGLGIAWMSGVDWRTLVLGAAPGGAVEMALTAKFLQQNVVLITTFHLVRIFIFMPNIPWIVRLLARREQHSRNKESRHDAP